MPSLTRCLSKGPYVAGLAALVATGSACSTHADAPACVVGLTTSCSPTYSPPTFDAIHTNILVPDCAIGTGTCHTADYVAGGLQFTNEAMSYQELLDGYVAPDDAGCSQLMERLESTDPNFHMPKGTNFLSPGDLWTITQWIAMGAPQ